MQLEPQGEGYKSCWILAVTYVGPQVVTASQQDPLSLRCWRLIAISFSLTWGPTAHNDDVGDPPSSLWLETSLQCFFTLGRNPQLATRAFHMRPQPRFGQPTAHSPRSRCDRGRRLRLETASHFCTLNVVYLYLLPRPSCL